MSTLTPAQEKAVKARGDILVVAGAGAGKTHTLVERCLGWLAEDKANSLDQILMVTFTEAAAASMRERLRKNLEKTGDPQAPETAEQLAFLETAHICTLHSFCLRLVRQHFYELGLDPALLVLADDQSQQLARKAMDSVLNAHYEGRTENAAAVQSLILDQGRGWDVPVRELIMRLHAYTQTLPEPEAWFAHQLDYLQREEPTVWRVWLDKELIQWRSRWLPHLCRLAAENPNAALCAKALQALPEKPSREEFANALAQILQADSGWPDRQKTRLRAPLEKVFSEAVFLNSICACSPAFRPSEAPNPNGLKAGLHTCTTDPLTEDWNWVRPQMLALLSLAQEFERAFTKLKRDMGGVDFHDLEQLALRLLRDAKTKRPTAIAEHWRSRFRLIFVDEYQDINAAQDAIIQALGGQGPTANRFLVGDIKQSIYRFRLADPRIFLNYQRTWAPEHVEPLQSQVATANGLKAGLPTQGQVIDLSENFRSHEAILEFVNAVFGVLMKKEIGGIDYDEAARLRFGNREGRIASSLTHLPQEDRRVEFHLRISGENEDSEAASDAESMSEAEKEAQLIAKRLLELKNQPAMVHDRDGERPVTWNDMVILLRSPRSKVEAFVKEFGQLGIPIAAARGGFYESLEVGDLLSLLKLLDNPLQDYPLLTVLRSPLVGLTVNDLAEIRVAQPKGRFWTALVCWHRENQSKEPTGGASVPASRAEHQNGSSGGSPHQPLFNRVDLFLKRFYAWRALTRHLSVSRCLELVLDETHYADWLLTQDRGEQRRANVERLLQMTRQFDLFHREGLYRFLKFAETQQELEIETEPAAVPVADAVRLMSIHQSKGLEFPIVVLANLGKKFNMGDTHGRIILDEELGLCPQVKPPHARQFYPSLPHWLGQRRQRNETLGEELRLLYVALTRAADRLLLVGSARSESSLERWNQGAEAGCGIAEIQGGHSFLDWIATWLCLQNGAAELGQQGMNPFLSWKIYNEPETSKDPSQTSTPELSAEEKDPASAESEMQDLQARLEWRYPHDSATQIAAKTSVSALRREIVEEEAATLFAPPVFHRGSRKSTGKLTAAQMGSAHHAFLELVSLDQVGSNEQLKTEAERLLTEKQLTADQIACLDFESLLTFWQSDVGQLFLAQKSNIRRELAFTTRFSAAEFAKLSKKNEIDEAEFVIVQGVIDLAVVLPEEIWLLDFKTDSVTPETVQDKVQLYQPQLKIYGLAISRIYGRPVTKSWLHFLATNHSIPLSD